MNYQLDFKDKVVCITGAGRGLGQHIAEGFGSLGAHVVVVSRTKEQLEETAEIVKKVGGKSTIITADLTKISEIQRLVEEIKEKFGRLDVLVNNSGAAKRKPSIDVTEEDWDFVVDINLKALFFLCKQVAVELMIPQGKGKIVNTASIGGILGITRSAPYSSSKGGVVLLTKVLGCEWAKHDIQVNAIAPGYIASGLGEKAVEDKDLLETIVRRTPAGRMGKGEEVVGAALYLASDLANYVTGHTLLIDGGLSAFAV